MEISFDLNKTLNENASVYFDKSKKAKKKLEGAEKALEESKKHLEKEEKEESKRLEKQTKKKNELSRKKEWHEKFRWFISSDDFLVIGGKDASSNESVIKKYTDPSDVVFHTEAPGSPFVVIKNPDKKEIPETTKGEAATFTAIYSKAWSINARSAEVFEVNPEQVSKEANSGEYVAKGAFVIRGKKKFYEPIMDLSIGYFFDENGCKVIMAGPVSAVKNKCEEHIIVKQGNLKKGDASKIIMKKFKMQTNDDILGALPSGNLSVNAK